MKDLKFSEVTRALRALSSAYVERRTTALPAQKALDGAGKRAAFALYYSPIHFTLIQKILDEVRLKPDATQPDATQPDATQPDATQPDATGTVIDLGCGTGVGGAALALATTPPSRVIGVDMHPWALDEARFTYRSLGLSAEVRRGHAARVRIPHDASIVVAAFVVNELRDAERHALLGTLRAARDRGVAILIVEPISKAISPWWDEWAEIFVKMGGRADEWRFKYDPPTIVKRLARASGLHPETLTARSLFSSR